MLKQLTCDLSGEVAIITGAAQGIGKALAEGFAETNCCLVVADVSDKIHNVAKNIRRLNMKCDSLVVDVSNIKQVKMMVNHCIEQYRKIDILINNAGVTEDNLLLRMKKSQWDNVVNTNLNAIFLLTKICLKGMTKQRFGRIINISSVVGATGNPGQTNYAATKAGMVGFTKSLAHEVASRGITVNAVAPGFIATDMTDEIPDAHKSKLIETIPQRRLGQPEDIAHAVEFLTSDRAGYITGQVLHVNGGMFMGF